MTDEKTQQLENRIDKLESTIEKMMPSRRDALKMGGAALVGGAAMSGTASAGTNQVGTIGSQASPVDLESEDINNADTVTTDTLDSTTLDNSGTVTTDTLDSTTQNNSGTVTTQDLVVNGTATGEFGGGIVFEDGDPITEHRADRLDVPNSEFFDIFNLSNPVDVYGGTVYGKSPSNIRITFSSNNQIRLGSTNDLDIGKDSAGNSYSVHPIWPMADVLRIEIFNRSGELYGFQVFTT